MRILFTGGGTGGHIYPIIAVAEKVPDVALQAGISGVDLYYLGVPGIYGRLLQSAGFSVSRVVSAKLRRNDLLRNLLDIPMLFISIVQALWKVYWIMPDVLFSKGGPGALPVVFACAFYRVPIVIHESDSVAGLTNTVSGRFAERIGVAFAGAEESFLERVVKDSDREIMKQRIALVGNPIRNFFFAESDLTTAAQGKAALGLDQNKPLLLVLGGSQGSVRINEFILSIAEDLMNKHFQIVHQTGNANYESVQREVGLLLQKYSADFKHSYRIIPYFNEDIKDAMIAADLVISRAGSGSIFEIAAMGRPSMLIPLPESAFDHQVKNAYIYARTGAAIAIEEGNLTKNIFMTQLDKLFAQPNTLSAMGEAAKTFSRPHAAEMLAAEIIKLGRRG